MKKILLGFIAMLISTISFSQKIHFNYKDSTKSSYGLEDVRKITFDGDLMNLHLLDGSLYAWNVSTIGNYEYEEAPLNTQELLNKANAWNLSVFPNPTSTNLNVSFNLPKADEMSIALYDLQGKVVLEKKLGTKAMGKYQELLNISALPNGVYVCRISGVHNSITKQIIKK
jgi:hypothetical protein